MEDIALTKAGGSYLNKLETSDLGDEGKGSEDYMMLKYFQLGGHLEDLLNHSRKLNLHRSVIRRLFEVGYIEETSENKYIPLIV